ncbi:MAG TPA: glycosyltransferase family 9 protein [Fibrobacteria bacterium]|nr:glycosyltransferase family 9 protein [Fibrobacteria bacterium]
MNGPVLVILPHNPGDVVMALLAIRRIKAEHAGLEVDYLVSEECLDLVRGSPLIRRAIAIPKRALKGHWSAGDAAAVSECLESFLADLASVRYRLSANLFQERSGALLQAFVEADRKIGLELIDGAVFQVKSRFLEHLSAIPADRGGNGWHVVDIYVRALARALDEGRPGDALRPPPKRRPPERRAENAASLLPPLIRPEACKSLAPGEYLAFHPGSAWAGKRWPESHWAALASRCARAGFPIAFTGAPEEKPVMERIRSAMDAAARGAMVDCIGATSLAGAAWVCAHARMVITGDTVAMHLAAAAGVQTLSLFGASNPVETGPYGKGHVLIQTDANPPPDLAFEKEHPGLAHLGADEVADYLLEGIPPPGFAMWETGWDEARRMQILTDARRLPHPSLVRAAGLMRVLDREHGRGGGTSGSGGSALAAETPLRPMPGPDDPRDKLRGALEACLGDAGTGNLAALEACERELAADTQASLVWEAYRIAVNGLSLRDLRAHLAARRERFDLALREEASARAH